MPVAVRAGSGLRRRVAAVVDTGFDGDLVLPAALIRDLGLEYQAEVFAVVGDDRQVQFATYAASVEWLDASRDVLVLEADSGPLLGMPLLHGCRLIVDVLEGGEVRIEPRG